MKDSWIKAKERWAAKMAGKGKREVRSKDRLPPGQKQSHNFPVLDLGRRPGIQPEQWELRISGLVEQPLTLSWEAFRALPRFADTSDFHCVTTWSEFDVAWEGVAFFTLVDLVKPLPEASHLFITGYDDYSTNVALDPCMDDDVLLADTLSGEPLPEEHGGPVRLVIPKVYAWKSAKFIKEIEFTDQHRLGYWELRGYSDTADPWTDDRFR